MTFSTGSPRLLPEVKRLVSFSQSRRCRVYIRRMLESSPEYQKGLEDLHFDHSDICFD